MTPIDDPSDEQLARHVKDAFALQDAPEAWVRQAISLALPRPSAWREPLRRLQAMLAVDSWAVNAGVLAVRGGAAPTRHLLFRAEGHDIDLRIAEIDAVFSVAGQVLGPEESGEVTLLPALPGAPTRTVLLDEGGEFRLEALPAGRYELSLQLGPDLISLPALEIGRRGA